MNAKQTRDVIAFVLHSWPSVPWRNDEMVPLIKAWHLILMDVDVDEAIAVLADLARSGAPFPPPPGVIVKTVLDMHDSIAGTRVPDADEAWAEIQRGIASHGFVNGQPEWSHVAVASVVSALTWRELCMSTNPDTIRAHFLRLYDTAARRVTSEQRSVARAALNSPARLGELPSRVTPD